MQIKKLHRNMGRERVDGSTSEEIWFEILGGDAPEIDFKSLISEQIHRPTNGLVIRDIDGKGEELLTISLSVADSRSGYFGSVRFQSQKELFSDLPRELREPILALLTSR